MLASLLIAGAILAGPTANLDKVLAKPITQVRSQTKLAILLPKTLPVPTAGAPLYGSATGSRERYEFRVNSTPDCEAHFCFAASFSAEKGRRIGSGGQAVTLTKKRQGRYWPISCGASCAPAVIAWKERGATYTIEAMVPTAGGRRTMLDLANGAIKRGPR